MRKLEVFELPLLAGMSRKRMIWQLFGTSADEALNGTTIVDTIALMNGASILRVHDVKEAVETVKIYLKIKNKE
jgi:dihydropteroate synthase